MAVGDLVTADTMFEFDGVLFGGECTGLGVDLIQVDGLDMPELRTGDLVRPRDHGMLPGDDFLSGRTITVDLAVVGSSATDLEAKLASLASMSYPLGSDEVELPLVFQLPGQVKRRANARLRRRNYAYDINILAGHMQHVTLQFFATDPRIYDDVLQSLNILLPVATGGLSWPVSWPVAWSSSTSGGATFNNAGTFETRPIITFSGPLTSPNVQNVTTGKQWSSIFDLQSGDQLVVDFAQRTVLLNGTASRYSSVTAASDWWTLVPGNNVITIGAAAGSGSATIVARSAWI